MAAYREARDGVDDWFTSIQKQYPERMECGRGCSMCCHGLFGIGVPDALQLTIGMTRMAPGTLAQVREKAGALQEQILDEDASLRFPFLFDGRDDDRIDPIVERLGGVPCPFLGPEGDCLVYDERPMACRVEGVPLVDVQDGPFSDWCELTFVDCPSGDELERLAYDWMGLTGIEEAPADAVPSSTTTGINSPVKALIDSFIMAYGSYWKSLLEESGLGGKSHSGGRATTSS
jgi:Fe-S-cluster containining protein